MENQIFRTHEWPSLYIDILNSIRKLEECKKYHMMDLFVIFNDLTLTRHVYSKTAQGSRGTFGAVLVEY